METATCGSENSLDRICVEFFLDLLITLRCLGVPIRSLRCMFGDNKIVVDNIITPHGKMHKRHMALSFHRVMEAIATKIVNHLLIDGKINPTDVLTKHWAGHDVWPTLNLSFLSKEYYGVSH